MSWQDIDQLTRIMLLVGKPSEALLEKMGSDEVSVERQKSLLCALQNLGFDERVSSAFQSSECGVFLSHS